MATGRDTVTTADMRRPIMADTHHTMVTDTAIGECIVRPTLTMVVRATMAVGTGVGVTTEKRLTLRRMPRSVYRSGALNLRVRRGARGPRSIQLSIIRSDTE